MAAEIKRVGVASIEDVPPHFMAMKHVRHALGQTSAYLQFSGYLADNRIESVKLVRTGRDTTGPVYFDPDHVTPELFGKGLFDVIQELKRMKLERFESAQGSAAKAQATMIRKHFIKLERQLGKKSTQPVAAQEKGVALGLVDQRLTEQKALNAKVLEELECTRKVMTRLVAAVVKAQSKPAEPERVRIEFAEPEVQIVAEQSAPVAAEPSYIYQRPVPIPLPKPQVNAFTRLFSYLRNSPPVGA